MKTQELNVNELKNVNGGFLGLGGDDSSITNILQGSISISHQDEDGYDNNRIDFGLGSMTDFMND